MINDYGKRGLNGTSVHDPEKWTPVFRKDHAASRC
jgi:hypothetical protein